MHLAELHFIEFKTKIDQSGLGRCTRLLRFSDVSTVFTLKQQKRWGKATWKGEVLFFLFSQRIFCLYILREIHIRFLLALLSAFPNGKNNPVCLSLKFNEKGNTYFSPPVLKTAYLQGTFSFAVHSIRLQGEQPSESGRSRAPPSPSSGSLTSGKLFCLLSWVSRSRSGVWGASAASRELIYGADAAVLWISAVSCSALLTVRHLLVLLCVSALY